MKSRSGMRRRGRRFVNRSCGGCKPLAIWILIAIAVSLLLLHFHHKDRKGSACGVSCPPGQKSFYVKTGTDKSVGPTICYDGDIYMSDEKQNVGRGLNVLFIDGDSHKVIDQKTFDTYSEDQTFLQYVQLRIKDGTVVIMASFDEITNSMKDDAKKWLKLMGASKVEKVKFRESYLLIGQRGLKQGHAIEFYNPKIENEQYGAALEKKGCFRIPLGPVEDITKLLAELTLIKPGSDLENCGLKSKCDGTPIQVYTGDMDASMPHICVAGKMIMEKDLNNAGRGFNIVVLHKDTREPKLVARFDTYETSKDSTSLETFLKQLNEGDIVIGVISDDAARKLEEGAIKELNALGSSAIQNLRFRDVWYFIGQKGIQGFTELEEISFATYDGDWPTQIKKSICLPRDFKGVKVAPIISTNRNMERREFCKKYDGYSEFCDVQRVDELLKTVPLQDKSKAKDVIYKTPILIIPGLDHNALARLLETTHSIPGVHPELVTVVVDEQSPDHGELAALFKFQNFSLGTLPRYEDKMNSALEKEILQTESKYVIVIEEEIVLTPDFLDFMSQCLPALEADESLFGISAFNYNGFETTSGDHSRVNRVEDFPGLAFLLKRSVFESQMKSAMEKCCNKRSWDSWTLKTPGEMLVPDVSRVFRLPYQSSNDANNYLENLFYKPRLTITEENVKLKNVDSLKSTEYEQEMKKEIKSSKHFPHEELKKCGSKGDSLEVPSKGGSFVIYFADKDSKRTVFHKLCKCFGLYSAPEKPLKGLHKESIRFFFKETTIFLVGSRSPYFEMKPDDVKVYE
ncbi:protein O-linked-mannose beta-1,2-N-acetylglucosaminyltransferase 1-like isoform X2 [Saccostrea echinata]|uniref:protein O-linked-mannose beta-1,2-N-acetylglucosaminyltransferase 1-like isoform X2 n=1 Tax=Saccostrea echinata TaxID=191078 RepID=UPI002A7F2DE5|nr:protein O-linked-mannose beta-1,2-N-acetylglucosaminyltransferase 1-like isoform X2 [Saccostrea echinata]